MHGNQLPEVTISPVAIEIGTKAWQALLEEVYTTPKPGLVDTGHAVHIPIWMYIHLKEVQKLCGLTLSVWQSRDIHCNVVRKSCSLR